MSYECCKRITLDEKKNVVKVCIASSNVFPKTYETCELCKREDYSFDEKLLWLFYDLQSGSVQISSINDNTEKFEYALIKVREYLRENHIDSYEDLYCMKTKVFHKLINEELGIQDDDDWKKYNEWRRSQDKDYVNKLEDEYSMKALKEVYGKAFEIFKKALYEDIKGDYRLKYIDGYIKKLGKYDRGYNRFFYGSYGNGLVMSYKKAYIVKNDFSDRKLEIEKA